jgi:hypothetical protein
MQIRMVFEKEDIKTLIVEHLRSKGIKVDPVTMVFRGSAKVIVEVDGAEIETEDSSVIDPPPPAETLRLEEPRATPPPDISDIRAASAALKDKKPGMYGEPAKSSLAGAMTEEEARAFLTNGGGRPSGR